MTKKNKAPAKQGLQQSASDGTHRFNQTNHTQIDERCGDDIQKDITMASPDEYTIQACAEELSELATVGSKQLDRLGILHKCVMCGAPATNHAGTGAELSPSGGVVSGIVFGVCEKHNNGDIETWWRAVADSSAEPGSFCIVPDDSATRIRIFTSLRFALAHEWGVDGLLPVLCRLSKSDTIQLKQFTPKTLSSYGLLFEQEEGGITPSLVPVPWVETDKTYTAGLFAKDCAKISKAIKRGDAEAFNFGGAMLLTSNNELFAEVAK